MTEQLAHSDSWRTRQSQLQLVVLGVAVALAALVVALLMARNDDASAIPAVNDGPKLVSQAQLEDFAGTLDHPLYWAGPKQGYSLELTRTSGGKIFLRYLPKGVAAGDSRPEFLTVGTYAGPESIRRPEARLGPRGLRLALAPPQRPRRLRGRHPDERLLRLPRRVVPGRGLLAFRQDRPLARARRPGHAGRLS